MNKLKEYNDRIEKLENERGRLLRDNEKLYYKIEDLKVKRDKVVCIGIPFSLLGMTLVTVLASVWNMGPNVIGTCATIGGLTVCGLGIDDLRLGLKIGKLSKNRDINEFYLEKNEHDIDHAYDLLESYEKLNSISNEDIITNKNNLVHNNSFVNNVVKSRNKIKSLAYKKVNNIRK